MRTATFISCGPTLQFRENTDNNNNNDLIQFIKHPTTKKGEKKKKLK